MITVAPLLEICAADIGSVIVASEGGADRVELCSALEADGVTPSLALIRAARRVEGIKVNVLIRPRSGNFVYTPAEVAIMCSDIRTAVNEGADGVVIGALTASGDVDIDACRSMMEAAEGVPVTFHRAFDVCSSPEEALEQIIELGCARVLTSGCAPSALEGIPMLRRLVKQSAGRIIIMPGAGVNPDNASEILHSTGATEIHGSLRSTYPDGRTLTDPQKVALTKLNISL